ncbi:hypothetical protein KBY66_00225 [Synechococcus sp. Tobar12-5m-g]|uniref:hypothetical protein n=1 Tax=unclassified Synechococcus TaxID=2626047 RepID=UPI0020CF7D6B|nr:MULTISPECIES: hypothetical protein [unclassified Synechococcus]MCP9771061.1 hypothetical protein [Synechococcus sp. Tobar12-5m-g]MCP9872001.1 hypothetical protein [Synechococcus sp. Cruz CV-v-12]
MHQSITTVLTPYGFRDAAASGRNGYALGASLLPLPLQVEIHGLLQANADRLGDPSGQAIARELGRRLQRSGIVIEAVPPVRTFFNRSPWAIPMGSAAQKLPAADPEPSRC